MNRNITALILIALAIGIYFTVTADMIEEAKAVKAINDQYSSALSNAAKLIATRDDVDRRWSQISPTDRDRLDKMIPSTVDNIRLIIDINSIAVQHGFSLLDVKAAASTETESNGDHVASRPPPSGGGNTILSAAESLAAPVLDSVDVTFTASATYNQFVSFLQDLESNLRLTEVTNISILSADNGVYTYQVGLRTYWLRQS